MTPAEAARAYLARGWHPIALWAVDAQGHCRCPKGAGCTSAGKHPIRHSWQADPEVHLGDFDKCVNVGIVTGRRSGFFVLDIDTEAGLAELRSRGELTSTYAVRTGGGGYQLYYALPDHEVPNSASKLAPGVDIRGEGGQVVAPPSVSGKGPYSVVHDSPVMPAPGWLLDALARPVAPERPKAPPVESNGHAPNRYQQAAIDGELARLRDLPQPWHEGAAWDQTTFEVACQLVQMANSGWMSHDEAHDLLEKHAPTDEGWSYRNVNEKWKAALKTVKALTRIEDPTDPFSPTFVPPAVDLPKQNGQPDDSSDALDAELEAKAAFDRAVILAAYQMRVRKAATEMLRAEERPPAEPFDAGWLAELLERPPEPPMRADGLIPSNSGTLLVAQRKTGKTTFMLNWARCLITGEPLLGKFEMRPIAGNVAVLNYEVSGATFARWADEHGVPRDRLLIVNVRGRRNPLADDEDRAHLAQFLRSREIEALAVDPFGRAYTGEAQNDAGEVGLWLTRLDVFARSEAGVNDLMLSAHAGWNGERTRGSSALEDWADSVITLTRTDDPAEDKRYLRALGRDVDVAEDALEFDPLTRSLSLTGEGSRKDAGVSFKLTKLAVMVERYARAQPGITGKELELACREAEDAIPFRKGDVAQAGRLAESNGAVRIVSEGIGKPTRYYSTSSVT